MSRQTGADVRRHAGWHVHQLGDLHGAVAIQRSIAREILLTSAPVVMTRSFSTNSRLGNLCRLFGLDALAAGELERLEAKAAVFGDYILGGHLMQGVCGYPLGRVPALYGVALARCWLTIASRNRR